MDDRSKTPPTLRVRKRAVSPPTPDITKRIEENRLKAKAIRERYLATESSQTTSRTPSGFHIDKGSTGAKRRSTSGSSGIPETSRDARYISRDEGIQPARKYKKYIDHDFSKMIDTKGGFLNAEDDPWNKAMSHNNSMDSTKPSHMTLKEWERHQLLKGLRKRMDGPFEPGIGLNTREHGKKCRECGSLEIDWQWEEVFKCAVCSRCKETLPEKYSLLTKTEAKDDYLLTDPELKDAELLPHLSKPNPHKSHWHDMMLFLRYQVEEYAFEKKWGSAEALDAEFEKREAEKKIRKEEKFKSKLRELKKKTRSEAFRRNNQSMKGGAQFGDHIGGQGRHEHQWGQTIQNVDGNTVKICIECGMEVEELEF
ncbi:DNA repair protein RAD14 [Erysiphe neolycopersici]|uniref:DNA repair protein RAD14 n=1 Tax=Erysiphe neolycopersici TaxID=212602 RepID=A0A420HPW8_9PEZI|nr:DNA repair protein RAD14 [Erysiphe neolycopersici]